MIAQNPGMMAHVLAFAEKLAILDHYPWRIHGAAIYGNMDPINISQMLA